MKHRYGIINPTPSDAKQVNRSSGICAAMLYLQKLEKLTPETIKEGLESIKDQSEQQTLL